MRKNKDCMRGRKPLKRLFAFLATFCILCGGLILTQSLRTDAADTYFVNITSNNTQGGGFGYGQNCDGDIHESYSEYLQYSYNEFSVGSITACPAEGYTFKGWLLDGVQASASETINRWSFQPGYNANNEMNLQAVFEEDVPPVENTVEIYASNTSAQLLVSGSGVDIVGNYSSHATVTTHEDQQVVTVGFNHLPDGLRVNASNPVTTTGDVAYNNDFNDNQFTLTVSGDGTATVNIEQPTLNTANIYISNGSLDVWSSSGGNITITNNRTGHVTTSAMGSYSVTAQVTVPEGYAVVSSNPVSTTGDVAYNNDFNNNNNNQFSLTISGNGTATVNIEQTANTYTVSIEPNDSSRGSLELSSGSNYTVENTSTGGLKIEAVESAGTITTDILVPVPADGYYFNEFTNNSGNTNWRRETEGNEYRYIFTLNGAGSVTANFVAYSEVKYNIGVNNTSAGSIDVNGGNCSAETKTNQNFEKSLVDIGEDYRSSLDTGNNDIVACVDDENYLFDHWEIDGNNISSDSTLNRIGTWPKNGTQHTLRAIFKEKPRPTTFEVSTSDASLGKIAFGDSCDGASIVSQTVTYIDGAFDTNSQPIRACAAENAVFVRWELDGNSYSTEVTIPYNANNVPTDGQNHTLRAVFASTASTPYTVGSSDYVSGSYAIGYDCNSPETADRSLSYVSGTFDTPNNAPIMACPLNGNAFLRWELDGQPYSQNAQIPYNASDLPHDGETHTLRAVFGTHNTVTIRPDNNSFGSIVGIEAGSGYTAVKQDSTLTITTDGGTVTTGTLTLDAAERKVFIGFTSETGNTTWTKGASDEEYTLTITGNDTLIAQFRNQTEYYLDIQNDHGSNGGIDMVDATCASENIRYSIEESYDVVKTSIGPVLDVGVPYIRACPNEGFVFVHWKLDGQPFSTDPMLSIADEHIINDYQNHHITAFFSEDDHQIYSVTVQVDSSEHGSVNLETGSNYNSSGSGGSISIHPHVDEPITTGVLTVTPANGYVFDYFTSAMGNTTWTKVGENQYQLHLTDTDTVVAHFRPAEIQVRYIIGPDDDTHGAINTTQDSCGDESTRIDILTGLDSNQAIDIAGNYIVACPNTNYTFSHWELDGQNISTNASLAKNAQTWPDTGTHELRAIFVDASQPDYSLPYTGSASIWIILGGGIGLVLIPSIVLIRKEYLEEKKGGKT